MRKHFTTLFDAAHRKLTMRFALISLILNVGSMFVVFSNFTIGILLLISGLSFFLHALVHPWNRGRNYAVMAGISIVLIMVIFGVIRFLTATGYEQILDKGLLIWLAGLICIPGIVVGVIGSIIYGEKAGPPNFNIPLK